LKVMTQLPLLLVHVAPYCHKIVGGHTSAIRQFIQSEVANNIDSRLVCPACDGESFYTRISAKKIISRSAPLGLTDPDEKGFEIPFSESNTIFHLHSINASTARLSRILRCSQIPYVFTSHGTLHYRGPLHFLKKFVYLNTLSPTVKNANGIHFLTSLEAARFSTLMPYWRGEQLVAPNAVAVPDSNQLMTAARSDFGIPQDCFLFMFLGRLDVHTKGLDILLRAFSRLAADGSVWLALVGPDWRGGRKRLTHLANRLRCANRVRVLDPQYGERKWQILKMANAFVSPSRWDAFAVAMIEAIGIGLPTITSNQINPSRELAEHQAALLSDLTPRALASAMQRLVESPALCRQLSAHGLTWIREHCTPQVVGAQLSAFYRRVLQQSDTLR
jgi:glycosyltransferase involved in cell wall biosynthesis